MELPWVSSLESDFNYDFGVAFTEEENAWGPGTTTARVDSHWPLAQNSAETLQAEIAATAGTDRETTRPRSPASARSPLEDSVVYHTYSAYARGRRRHLEHLPVARPGPEGTNEVGPGSASTMSTTNAKRDHFWQATRSLSHQRSPRSSAPHSSRSRPPTAASCFRPGTARRSLRADK